MENNATYKALLEATSRMMMIRGYHRTSVRLVMKSVHLGKGCFQNYFKSKEKMTLEVLDQYFQYLNRHNTIFNNSELSPFTRIYQYFSQWCYYLEQHTDHRGGCLLGNLGFELADHSKTIINKINSITNDLINQLQRCIKEGQLQGEIEDKYDAADLAELIMITWQGAIWRMRISKDRQALQLFLDCFLQNLKSVPIPAS